MPSKAPAAVTGARERRSHGAAEVVYPFSAIVGQLRLKRALVLCAINPDICGVLIRGEKGTGKSTAVCALAGLLPNIDVFPDCAFACDPSRPDEWCEDCQSRHPQPGSTRPVRMHTLPLNATEDRISGGIDFRRAVRNGRRAFEPGLLASVHRGVLYIDEVNLLDDHLVDVIVDTAASGVNRVEREGISVVHPARFILVGTMNPEEGALRPQLLDRFGLCVNVSGERNPADRLELMRRREAFDLDAAAFAHQWAEADRRLTDSIRQARRRLAGVTVTAEQRAAIARLCRQANVAGHRADLIMEHCARTIAAAAARTQIQSGDICEAAEFVLPHRTRQTDPPAMPPSAPERTAAEPPAADSNEAGSGAVPEPDSPGETDSGGRNRPPETDGALQERIFAVGQTFDVRRIEPRKDRLARRGSGKRSHTRSAHKSGRYVRNRIAEDFTDLALDATLRAAAPYQAQRGPSPLAVQIRRSDIRKKIRQRRISSVIIFAVDASGSMGAKKRMISTKGAIMSLLLDAYRMRDRIALVAFRKTEAEVLLPFTNSVSVASRLLQTLPTGGRTPLSAGLVKAFELARARLYKDPLARPILIVVTDGRGNASLKPGASPVSEALSIAAKMAGETRIRYIVVDTESNGFLQFGLAERLARGLNANHYRIEDLHADDLVRVIEEYSHA